MKIVISQVPTPLVYRVEEAAQALKLSRSVMYELIRSGQIRSFKEGRTRLIPVSALQDYIESKQRAA